MAHRRVEVAQGLRLLIDDRDAQRLAQPPLDRLDGGRRGAAAQAVRQFLGGAVDAVDVIARIVEPVADLLPRQAAALGGTAGQRLVDDLEPLSGAAIRSEEHTSELQSLMRISYAVFC